MKIGLDTAPAALRETYFQHLASVLARYAPEHEYVIGTEVNDGVDLYHGFRSSLPLSVHLRRVPSVMTVPNLNFLRYPHLYTFAERLFVLTLYRRALRRAGRVSRSALRPARSCRNASISTLRRSRSWCRWRFRLRAEIHLKRNLNMCAASMLFQNILY